MKLNREKEFCGNKYFKWYLNICKNSKNRKLSKYIYTENHHIFPKSIFGENKDIIKLTAKEHYIVHLLLWIGFKEKHGIKNYKTIKLKNAFKCMNMRNNYTQRRYNSKLYSFLKIAYNQIGISEETRRKMSSKKLGTTPWNKGLPWSIETRNKLRLANLGDKNPNYGTHFSKDHRNKISESNKIAQNLFS